MLKRILTSVLVIEFLSLTAVVWAQSDRPATAPKKAAVGNHDDKKPPRNPTISKEEEEKLLKLLKDKRPEQYKRLMQLKKTDERRYRWAIRSLANWYRMLEDMPEEVRNAEVARYDTRLKIWQLVKQIRKTDDAGKKAELTDELRKATATMFDAEQVIHEYQVKMLEQRVNELRAELKSHKEQRDEIIDQRVNDYLKGRVGAPKDHPGGPGEEPQEQTGRF